MTALLILAVVVGVVLVTATRSTDIAEEQLRRELASSHMAMTNYHQLQLQQLELFARLFSSDSPFISYVAEATGGGLFGEAQVDTLSLLNQLRQKQDRLAFEIAVLINPVDTTVLVRTDRPDVTGVPFTNPALLEAVTRRGGDVTGFWLEDGRLYQTAVVPLAQNFDLFGVLLVGFGVNDLPDELERVTGTETAYLVSGPDGIRIAASSLEQEEQNALEAALTGNAELMSMVLQRGQPQEFVPLDLPDIGRFQAYVAPLLDPNGEIVGASVALASLDDQLAASRRIQRVALITGAVALILALLGSFALSRRILRPVQDLAEAAEAAAQGDYDRRIAREGSDEVGRLASAFDTLLSDLREKRDIESYVSDLSRYLPDPSANPAPKETASLEMSMVAIEMRGYARSSTTRDSESSVGSLLRDLRRCSHTVASQYGKVASVLGHRVLLTFEGDRHAARATSAASDILRAMVNESSGPAPAVAVTTGDAVSGPISWGEREGDAVLGRPVQELETLLREAAPGEVLLTQKVLDQLSSEISVAGVELQPAPAVLAAIRFYSLDLETAQNLTRPLARTSSLSTVAGSGPRATIADIGPGSLLAGRFEVLSVLGAGGMGVVYKARDRELDDLVALKTLHKKAWRDRESLDRLKSELKLARRITHPNVLRTFDFGEFDGIPYISMEYVRGLTARYLLDQTQRLPFSASLRLSRQLCAGLEAAHAVGVLHRDIKPENLIIDNAGNAKLMDFGIARPIRRMGKGATTPGTIIGTPHYLSPEQLQGEEADQRSDLYACGVVFYEMFTGELPFDGDKPMDIVMAHLREEPTPPSELWPEIPPPLEGIVLRCLAKDPAERYSHVAQLLKDLDDLRA